MLSLAHLGSLAVHRMALIRAIPSQKSVHLGRYCAQRSVVVSFAVAGLIRGNCIACPNKSSSKWHDSTTSPNVKLYWADTESGKEGKPFVDGKQNVCSACVLYCYVRAVVCACLPNFDDVYAETGEEITACGRSEAAAT
jgi:hypothetical protein